jgi:hypothetical protein
MIDMDNKKDLAAFAEIWAAANHTRNAMLSAYIRYIARAITILAKQPGSEKRPNPIPTTAEC